MNMFVQKTQRRHSMPFGAQLTEQGQVRFRLWAPTASRVELCLQDQHTDIGQVRLPMTNLNGGWYELITSEADIGSRYYFRIDGDREVPDPASRFQPEDVHGPSEVIDPQVFDWTDVAWLGRPWEETVIYELHTGSFTTQGNFAGIEQKLDYLSDLGITAVQLMPVADFPGSRDWGYDGVYLFAPDSEYGRPEALKALVDAAHARGLMVFLDVVYNHFGPEGNYLHLYAPWFFTDRHITPWGAAINYDGEHNHWVREFFIHNALYWLEEYHLDGLRFDAVHAIVDDSQPDILTELAQRVHKEFDQSRYIHLVLENDHNAAHYLTRDMMGRPRYYTAQWNDDIHHAMHVLLTHESGGYYQDYIEDPIHSLGRCLSEGFAYQGENSAYRDYQSRGEPSRHLPATAFVSFMQNHDQIGNRAFGERVLRLAKPEQVRAVSTLLMLAPSPPLLFMGEEWGCQQPFPFFCDFGPDLAEKVSHGRRQEFARFPQFSDPAARERIPDPMNEHTFLQAVLDWRRLIQPKHQQWLTLYRELLDLRRREIMPRLAGLRGQQQPYTRLGERALSMQWQLGDGSLLFVLANLGDEAINSLSHPPALALYATHAELAQWQEPITLPPWSVVWYLHTSRAATA